MKPLSLAVLLGTLCWHGLASAQPAHAPAHGARGHQEQQAGQNGREHRQEHRHEYRRDREQHSERYIDLPRINERELLGLLRQYEAPAPSRCRPAYSAAWSAASRCRRGSLSASMAPLHSSCRATPAMSGSASGQTWYSSKPLRGWW